MKNSQKNAISYSYIEKNWIDAKNWIKYLKDQGLENWANFIWKEYKQAKTISKNCKIISIANNEKSKIKSETPTKSKLAIYRKEYKY